jgi:hypothetical protein
MTPAKKNLDNFWHVVFGIPDTKFKHQALIRAVL